MEAVAHMVVAAHTEGIVHTEVKVHTEVAVPMEVHTALVVVVLGHTVQAIGGHTGAVPGPTVQGAGLEGPRGMEDLTAQDKIGIEITGYDLLSLYKDIVA